MSHKRTQARKDARAQARGARLACVRALLRKQRERLASLDREREAARVARLAEHKRKVTVACYASKAVHSVRKRTEREREAMRLAIADAWAWYDAQEALGREPSERQWWTHASRAYKIHLQALREDERTDKVRHSCIIAARPSDASASRDDDGRSHRSYGRTARPGGAPDPSLDLPPSQETINAIRAELKRALTKPEPRTTSPIHEDPCPASRYARTMRERGSRAAARVEKMQRNARAESDRKRLAGSHGNAPWASPPKCTCSRCTTSGRPAAL